jgi:hypothetical protein
MEKNRYERICERIEENDDDVEESIMMDLKRFIYRFRHMSKTQEEADDDIHEQVNARAELYIIPGLRVMLLRNLDQGGGLVHGLQGSIVGRSVNGHPLIRWDPSISSSTPTSSEPYELHPFIWKIPFSDGKLCYCQYPIEYAKAMTVHKSQAMTIEKAKMDLGDAFCPGHVYSALSRVPKLTSLFLIGHKVQRDRVFSDHRVIEYYDSILNFRQPQSFVDDLDHLDDDL